MMNNCRAYCVIVTITFTIGWNFQQQGERYDSSACDVPPVSDGTKGARGDCTASRTFVRILATPGWQVSSQTCSLDNKYCARWFTDNVDVPPVKTRILREPLTQDKYSMDLYENYRSGPVSSYSECGSISSQHCRDALNLCSSTADAHSDQLGLADSPS